MIISSKGKFLKNLKLNSNVNKIILAKTLFAINPFPSELFLNLVANTLVNRFVADAEISDSVPNIVNIFTSVDCWKNLKFMDCIDLNNKTFQKCLKIANKVLSGELDENFSSILSFHKKSENHLLTNNVKPKFEMDGFSFFDVYI